MVEATVCPEAVRPVGTEREKEPLKVCFVCTGNTCRSPMAEAMLRAMEAETAGRTFVVTSAGLAAAEGMPITPHAVQALAKAGVAATAENDYPHHTARQIGEADLLLADVVIGLTSAHALTLLQMFPSYAERIYAMPVDIPDPYGGDLAVYQTCLAAIRRGLAQLFFETGHRL